MPKMVSELAQGNQFSRSSDGGQLSDSATRVFKIILNSPNESIDLMQAVGVQIGDQYSNSNPIPCVSVEGRADGESRLVRIVTCQYKSSNMVDGEGGTGLPDPMLVMPDVRPANFSTSTSLYEMPAVKWKAEGESWKPIRNTAGDPVDGVMKLEPITTIRVTQFTYLPGTVFAGYVGYLNSQTMTLGSYGSMPRHTVMFRGVEATPHVETHGIVTYRGFMNVYEFAYRRNWVDGFGPIGWDHAVIMEGYNCIAATPNFVSATLDSYALPLMFEEKADGGFQIKNPPALQDGVTAGQKVRAMVPVGSNGKYVAQNPSSLPIALNSDGTPRRISDTNLPVVVVRQVQDDIDLTSTLQLRL